MQVTRTEEIGVSEEGGNLDITRRGYGDKKVTGRSMESPTENKGVTREVLRQDTSKGI